MTQKLILVDSQDQPVGLADKLMVHQQGLLHRAFSIFIVNSKKELLLQQRALHKYHCAGLWSNTCCSHPFAHESVLQAGHRRLQEELGLVCQLDHAGWFIYRAELQNGLIEHELDHVLVGHYRGELLEVSPEEIADIQWVSLPLLEAQLAQQPGVFTPWLAQALSLAKGLIESGGS